MRFHDKLQKRTYNLELANKRGREPLCSITEAQLGGDEKGISI